MSAPDRDPLADTRHGAGAAHLPVLLDEAMTWLAPKPGGRYCDATVGAGGHAAALLERSSPDGRLVALDRDPVALATAGERLQPFGDRVTLVHARFSEAQAVLERLEMIPVDGFLVDLGVSSPQLDRAERGFSFRHDGPLDMRMDPTTGETAAQLLRRVDEGELTAIVARALPRHEHGKNPATRTFQALRITVNDELGELERFLAVAADCLRPGGRLVVIAFHSLEDRIVKRRLRALAGRGGAGAAAGPARLRLLTKHVVVPGDDERARNPRARSARLRAAERL